MKILWLLTGGTITCNRTDNGLVPENDAAQFTPYLPQGVDVTPRELMCIDSTNATVSDFYAIAKAVFDSLDDYDGFVVTFGTDTMAYCAAFASLALANVNKPVVFTGAQNPITDADGDGASNFAAAFNAAMTLTHGVWLAFGGKLISGGSAVKIDSRAAVAFADVSETGVEPSVSGEPFLRSLTNEKTFIWKVFPALDSQSQADDFAALTEYIISREYKHVIIEGFGTGNVQIAMLPAIVQLIERGITVTITTQCVFGGTDVSAYAGVGRPLLTLGASESGLDSAALTFAKQFFAA